MPLLTLFTAPKPFTDPHISIIQRNSLRNWQELGTEVQVIVVGDEPGIRETCDELGVHHIPNVRCNDLGTPLISSIFDLARRESVSPFLAYSNADILLFPDLIDAIKKVSQDFEKFLLVGQRWDLNVTELLEFSTGWENWLARRVHEEGQLHGQTGSDFFVYPRACFKHIPDFAVGRAGWDNWMIFQARWQHWPVVDVTEGVTVAHQNHDFSHLPGGVKHFWQPETEVNVRLAGGRRTIFRLEDATHVFDGDELRRKSLDWYFFWREVEILPLTILHSRFLGWLSFAIFHPAKALNEIKGWLAYKLDRS